jgi:hypothetical protein
MRELGFASYESLWHDDAEGGGGSGDVDGSIFWSLASLELASRTWNLGSLYLIFVNGLSGVLLGG